MDDPFDDFGAWDEPTDQACEHGYVSSCKACDEALEKRRMGEKLSQMWRADLAVLIADHLLGDDGASDEEVEDQALIFMDSMTIGQLVSTVRRSKGLPQLTRDESRELLGTVMCGEDSGDPATFDRARKLVGDL